VALVLAIESDPRQAGILRRVVREHVPADLVVSDCKDAAVAAIASRMPDLILVSALISPREEADLTEHLRGLQDAEHLQTLTIPLLAARPAARRGHKRTLRGLSWRRAQMLEGCDPSVFADEIRGYLDRAREVREQHEWRCQHEPAESAGLPELREDAAASAPAAAPAAGQPELEQSPEDPAETAAPALQIAELEEPSEPEAAPLMPAVAALDKAADAELGAAREDTPPAGAHEGTQAEDRPDEDVTATSVAAGGIPPTAVVAVPDDPGAPSLQTEPAADATETVPPGEEPAAPGREADSWSHTELEHAAVRDSERGTAAAEAVVAPEERGRRDNENAPRGLSERRPKLAGRRRAERPPRPQPPEPGSKTASARTLRLVKTERRPGGRRGEPAPLPSPVAAPAPEPKPAVPARDAVQDEWGIHDPSRCGFDALMARLDSADKAKSAAAPRKRRKGASAVKTPPAPRAPVCTSSARLMPLAVWARAERSEVEAAPRRVDVRQLFGALALPPGVAAVSYPTACRIRRIRVAPLSRPGARAKGDGRTVILSRRVLNALKRHGSSPPVPPFQIPSAPRA
jgi:hypothetical protein